jgi:3'-5' exoribonuclease
MSQEHAALQDSTPAAPGARRYLCELRPAERLKGVYTLINAQVGKTRKDKSYLRCLLADRTGEVPARMWDIDEQKFAAFPSDGFVWIDGETQAYEGEIQVIIQAIDLVEPNPAQLRELMPASVRDPEEMFAEAVGLLRTVSHPAMRALVKGYLDDAPLMAAFKSCPAAKSMHHAYLGGLLEHTLTLLQLADRVCPLYPKVNRDLVMVGLFIHDLGKTVELSYDKGFGYTDRGELVGHIVEGAIMLRDKAQEVIRTAGLRFPAGTLMVLEHIVLAHHGQLEFGSPKLPATPEAILVAMLDNLDAKTNIAVTIARPEQRAFAAPGNFTEKSWALETKLFKPDPLAGR